MCTGARVDLGGSGAVTAGRCRDAARRGKLMRGWARRIAVAAGLGDGVAGSQLVEGKSVEIWTCSMFFSIKGIY
jgi:hypothetical protein